MSDKLDLSKPVSSRTHPAKFLAKADDGRLVWQLNGRIVTTDDEGRLGNGGLLLGNGTPEEVHAARGVHSARTRTTYQPGELVIYFRPMAKENCFVLATYKGKRATKGNGSNAVIETIDKMTSERRRKQGDGKNFIVPHSMLFKAPEDLASRVKEIQNGFLHLSRRYRLLASADMKPTTQDPFVPHAMRTILRRPGQETNA